MPIRNQSMQLFVGCSGWSYSAWDSHFYPKGLESKKYPEYYSKVFDYVEIDSSFYRIPNSFMTKRWSTVTPDNFRFTARLPKSVTHDKRQGNDIESDMSYFYKSFEALKGKTLALLLQLPPSMTMKEGLKKLETFPFAKGYRYAVEVRHKTWFDQAVYDVFKRLDLCLVWNQLDNIEAPSILTTDFFYIHFIDDRSIDEKDLGLFKRIEKKRCKSGLKSSRKPTSSYQLAL